MRSGTTLINFGSSLPFGERTTRTLEGFAAGKLGAVLLGAAALGLVFALYPLRAPSATRMDVLLIGMAVLAQGAGYAAATLVSRPAAGAFLPFLSLLAAPAAFFLSSDALAAGSFLMVVTLGVALELCLVRANKTYILPLAALAVPMLVALAVSSPAWGAVVAAVLVLGAPVGGAYVHSPAASATGVGVPVAGGAEISKNLLITALAPEGRRLVVTDTMGKIDEALTPERGEAFAEGSLTEATLIADRVNLLHAMAETARGHAPREPMTLRLREGRGGAGYPMAAQFASYIVRFSAVPAHPGRVAVLMEPAQAPEVAEVTPAATANVSLLARALHDSLAPFNAGMGFLEMVADPRLAPRDFMALHDFAAEAHKAMGEAHRNAVLLGLWMRIYQDEAHARARTEVAPRRLLTEVLRLMNLEEMEKRGDLVGDGSFDGPVAYTLHINAVRFALATLLRFGMGAAHVDLAMAEEAGDLVFVLTRREGGDHPATTDAFQHALEEAAARMGDTAFEMMGPGCRRVRLRGVALSRRMAESIRIAS